MTTRIFWQDVHVHSITIPERGCGLLYRLGYTTKSGQGSALRGSSAHSMPTDYAPVTRAKPQGQDEVRSSAQRTREMSVRELMRLRDRDDDGPQAACVLPLLALQAPPIGHENSFAYWLALGIVFVTLAGLYVFASWSASR